LLRLQAWQRAVPREVMEGLLATESLRRQHGLKGVAGCLVDLLDVPPQLVTAADVVAGNQLFQVRYCNVGLCEGRYCGSRGLCLHWMVRCCEVFACAAWVQR
jgi:hypothetical protein